MHRPNRSHPAPQSTLAPPFPASVHKSSRPASLTYASMLKIVSVSRDSDRRRNMHMLDLQTVARLNGRTGRAIIHSAAVHPLASQLPSTTQGKKRPFSRENVLELTFRFTLVDYGLEAGSAAQLAEQWLAEYQRGAVETAPYRVLNLSRRRRAMPSGGDAAPVAVPFGESDTSLRAIQEYAPDWTLEDEARGQSDGTVRRVQSGAAVLVVDLAEIVRRVTALEGEADG